jgi:hypothetical protein
MGITALSQELLCRVSVSYNNVKGENFDKNIFKTLEQNLNSFMNDRKWSEYSFKAEEKIECGIQLVIEKASGNDIYEGKIYVQLNRPVYNSTYTTPLLSYQDNYVLFKYTTNQQFDYDEHSYLWTITSVAAYYANLFLALTFDSYAIGGGTPYYNKCVNIVSSAPPGEIGWQNTTKERRNRYWLLESFTNPSYDALRKFLYQYHLKGMDVMHQSTKEGVSVILSALESMQSLYTTYPGNEDIVILCMTKTDELVNVFSGATMEEKQKAANILKKLDPSNTEKYDKMVK